MPDNILQISAIRHPFHLSRLRDWELFRDTFEGGEYYLDRYLRKFSERETDAEYKARKDMTPIPTFAKSAILDIRNSIFQRLVDVVRTDGSDSYRRSVAGEGSGIDRRGSSMNKFIGIDVLTELLVMGRVGVFVDNTAPQSRTLVPTMADRNTASPYCYYYPVESILSYTEQEPNEPGTFKAVLLRDVYIEERSNVTGISLPTGTYNRYRLLWLGEDGFVRYRIYDHDERPVFGPGSDETGAVRLNIREIPFHVADIGDSLLKDAASYQRALLNLGSGDVNYALKSNVPFLTIQQELRTGGAHLKRTSDDATPGGQQADDNEEQVGAGTGRYYDLGTDRPDFIAPPTAPLEASMKLQERLEDNIRRLVNLAVENKVGSRTESAESKKLSAQGLEAGLSFIGLVLQQTEQQVAKYIAAYENPNRPNVATISYPNRYILKTDKERLEDAKNTDSLLQSVPSATAQKISKKLLATTLLHHLESTETLQKIENEIERAACPTADPTILLGDRNAGLVSDEAASLARGYAAGQVEKARQDHAERVARTLRAQTSIQNDSIPPNAASRGAPDLDDDLDSGSKEQQGEDGDPS